MKNLLVPVFLIINQKEWLRYWNYYKVDKQGGQKDLFLQSTQ